VIDWLNDNSGAVQAIAVAVLVLVTAVYAGLTWWVARATRRQADASVEMAREMREARHAGVLPVVDFVVEPPDSSEELGRVFRILAGHLPETQWGRLRAGLRRHIPDQVR
jgi:hypothetical protein